MVGSYLLQINLRSGHGCFGSSHRSTSANGNGESHGAPLLGPPPPLPPPLTLAEMMAEMLAARRETAHALEMMAQAIGGFARGGPGGNGGNRGGARGLERPYSD
jgi:hypothetical protein